MGDILLNEAKEVLKDKICIEGNIQIADMYEKPKENIEMQVLKLINDAFYDSKGLIVCPTASPYIPLMSKRCFENYTTLIESVLNLSAKV